MVTTVDISITTKMTQALIDEIGKGKSAAARYTVKYAQPNTLWDELAAAAWLDPSIITRSGKLYMDVSTDPGASYGQTLVWEPGNQPGLGEQLVEVQQDLDRQKFYKLFSSSLAGPTPGANHSSSNGH